MYDIQDEDTDSVVDQSQLSTATQLSSVQMQLPILELLKVSICHHMLICSLIVKRLNSEACLCF